MAVEYGGRVIECVPISEPLLQACLHQYMGVITLDVACSRNLMSSQEGVVQVKWDPDVIPTDSSSIDWWDWAQYQTCFSESSVTAEEMGISLLPQDRVCDQDLVFSENTEISTFEDQTGVYNTLILQSPSLIFDEGEGIGPLPSYHLRTSLWAKKGCRSFCSREKRGCTGPVDLGTFSSGSDQCNSVLQSSVPGILTSSLKRLQRSRTVFTQTNEWDRMSTQR